MRPDYGGVDHHVAVVRVIQQHLEYLLPDSGPGPAGETLVDALPVAESCRQIFPLGAAAQNPEYAVDEAAVVFGRNVHPALTARQKALYPVPLGIAQFITLHNTTSTTPVWESYTLPPRIIFRPNSCKPIPINCRFCLVNILGP